jgi:hypothetical protein
MQSSFILSCILVNWLQLEFILNLASFLCDGHMLKEHVQALPDYISKLGMSRRYWITVPNWG